MKQLAQLCVPFSQDHFLLTVQSHRDRAKETWTGEHLSQEWQNISILIIMKQKCGLSMWIKTIKMSDVCVTLRETEAKI